MTTFKVGQLVRVTCTQDEIQSRHGAYNVIAGHTYHIQEVCHGSFRLNGTGSFVSAISLEPAVTKVKPSNAMKPRIKTFASGKRQFDVEFKMMIVRTANGYSGTRTGAVAALLSKYSLDKGYLKYWRKQFNEGHFTANRAVAFSRKPTMIHG